MRRNTKRVHRLVVLPDYQGIGIGTKFITSIAKMYVAEGREFNLTTTTPAIVNALIKNKNWHLARFGRDKSGYHGYDRYKGSRLKHLQNSASISRITYSFWYEEATKGDTK